MWEIRVREDIRMNTLYLENCLLNLFLLVIVYDAVIKERMMMMKVLRLTQKPVMKDLRLSLRKKGHEHSGVKYHGMTLRGWKLLHKRQRQLHRASLVSPDQRLLYLLLHALYQKLTDKFCHCRRLLYYVSALQQLQLHDHML
jgi:hypothetical protein